MIHRLETKVAGIGNLSWPFDLCPSCRMKAEFEKRRIGKTNG
jgi:hypothetical protein